MNLSDGFAPLGASQPQIVILGSMPGQASLQQQQYYAHPRNAFWPILTEILALPPELPYSEYDAVLAKHSIMVWDVIAQCERKGSLDSAIMASTVVVNNFEFLTAGSNILVLCNGAKAYDLFIRHVKRRLGLSNTVMSLPSTSPAFATMPFAEKLQHWRVAMNRAKHLDIS